MKIRTENYVVYVEGGQVYKGGNYFRPLTDSQIEFIKGNKWVTKSQKRKLEKLIDDNFENLETEGFDLKEAMEKAGFDYDKQVCHHNFRFIEKVGKNYVFFCKKCLKLSTEPIVEYD